MPRILLLADINSAHIQKWGTSLSAKGFTIGIFSLNKCTTNWFEGNKNIEYLSEGFGSQVAALHEGSKLGYIKALPELKKAIRAFKPDIVHAHYATSYGMLGALSGFHPYVVSVWGSDVYEFPQKSFLHKWLLKRNLRKADCIMSTSKSMAEETGKYSNKQVVVTPFGVDLSEFKPNKTKTLFSESDMVVGTIKALEPKYGIGYLVEAFDIVQKRHNQLSLKLLIVGGGSEADTLKNQCEHLGIADKVVFVGKVPQEKVSFYHGMVDVFVALSIDDSESFGVAVVEAMASGKPVVVSNVSGFAEVVENGVTGIIVPVKNAKVAANAIEKIISDKLLYTSMATAGRKRVEELYNWENNLATITGLYDKLLKGRK